ncbi:hypothetical protein [Natronolimnohabitans innermongolicus]|uniref:Uncharacterized protein n=1 Tax=Natronolimnohabitans innermongolicus JCM 12255 TaxID=1227499 RepID=L9WKT8_9EURY|nr:hypothetical protein [Natronolimnohabitans innermongolicus]ELY48968.1 hypothetical protein C493_21266 [Natronolimnohabitans innermongolicus JCM 12255]
MPDVASAQYRDGEANDAQQPLFYYGRTRERPFLERPPNSDSSFHVLPAERSPLLGADSSDDPEGPLSSGHTAEPRAVRVASDSPRGRKLDRDRSDGPRPNPIPTEGSR